MLNDNIANEFKMSTDPRLIGWNSTMSIQDILNQLELSYGRPTGHKLQQIDALFRSPFHNTEAPKCLFWHIKQCQEIQVIADNLYTQMQLMTNAIQLLMASGIFPVQEFKDCEATANKMYGSLKVFAHCAYARRLVAVQLRTTGQHGYVANHNNNMFQMLEEGASVTDDDASVVTITDHTAANATTDSTLGNIYAVSLAPANPSPSPQEYVAAAAAIKQLSANQTGMWPHMQNLSLCNSAPPTHVANLVLYNPPRTAAAFQAPYQAPPIHSLTVPAPYQVGSFNHGRGMGGRTCHHPGRAGCSLNPFGHNAGRGAGTVFVPGGVVQISLWSIPSSHGPGNVAMQQHPDHHQKVLQLECVL
jgi:hypothetical protein